MIVAMFADEAGLREALDGLRAASVGPLETYTPAPMEGAPTGSPIPLVILLAALVGAGGSLWLQTWSSTVKYRFDVGARPQFSWASFVPTVWENAALVALVAGFVAFMVVNGLPRLHDPVDEADGMRRASRDRWVVQVASEDGAVLDAARRVLAGVSPLLVEELPG